MLSKVLVAGFASAGISPDFMACRGLFVEGQPPQSLPTLDGRPAIPLCKFDAMDGNPHGFPVAAIAYDPGARLAQWVAYRSDAWMAARTDNPYLEQLGRKEFYRDADLAQAGIEQQNPGQSYGSPWDRGHLLPSEMAQWDPVAWAQSYLASNVAPQHDALNQGPWRAMEEHVLTWVARQDGTMLTRPVHILTGVVYRPGAARVDKAGRPAIPSHYYKVVIDWAKGRVLAFAAPNDGSVARNADFWKLATTLARIEDDLLDGRRLFPGIPEDWRRQDPNAAGARLHWGRPGS